MEIRTPSFTTLPIHVGMQYIQFFSACFYHCVLDQGMLLLVLPQPLSPTIKLAPLYRRDAQDMHIPAHCALCNVHTVHTVHIVHTVHAVHWDSPGEKKNDLWQKSIVLSIRFWLLLMAIEEIKPQTILFHANFRASGLFMDRKIRYSGQNCLCFRQVPKNKIRTATCLKPNNLQWVKQVFRRLSIFDP